MALPPSTVLSTSLHTLRWVPALGLLLAGLGVLLLGLGLGELAAPTIHSGTALGRAAVDAPAPSGVAAAPSSRFVGNPTGSENRPGAGAAVRVAPEWSTTGGGCLGADLATGRRAESMHLATVPLQRPADCGDVRDVLVGLASLPHTSRDIQDDPTPAAFDGAALSYVDSLDLAAAALYGPPDRQPQATQEALLEQGEPDGGRGRARDYLEETAASRMLMP